MQNLKDLVIHLPRWITIPFWLRCKDEEVDMDDLKLDEVQSTLDNWNALIIGTI